MLRYSHHSPYGYKHWWLVIAVGQAYCRSFDHEPSLAEISAVAQTARRLKRGMMV